MIIPNPPEKPRMPALFCRRRVTDRERRDHGIEEAMLLAEYEEDYAEWRKKYGRAWHTQRVRVAKEGVSDARAALRAAKSELDALEVEG